MPSSTEPAELETGAAAETEAVAAQLASEAPRVQYTTLERKPLVETANGLQATQDALKQRSNASTWVSTGCSRGAPRRAKLPATSFTP